MANEPSRKPSFSLRQRWSIFFSVLISIGAMFAIIVMVNYLGSRYSVRFPWSVQTRQILSSQTLSVLSAVTNDINVLVYYNKSDELYDRVSHLLEEYHAVNKRIAVRTVNYLTDPAEAQKVKDAYANVMDPLVDTNVVIFSSTTGTNIVSGDKLGQHAYEPIPGEKGEHNFRDKLTAFLGEREFTEHIFSLINNHPVRAYFLETANSIHRLDREDDVGYQKFKALLQNININVTTLPSLHGTNGVPADCKLLIIAVPKMILERDEVENLARYLDHGGHLLVLFNYVSREFNTQLEPLLAKWGIIVGHNVVRDLDNFYGDSGNDVVVKTFNKSHPVVSHFQGFSLELAVPRSIASDSKSPELDSSAAQELAWTGNRATINDSPVTTGKPVPLIAAVEKQSAKGITDQGTTRILAVGDSYFLDNQMMGALPQNRAFALYAINWLAGQQQMLQGVGPQTVVEYNVMMTPAEAQNVRWILLGAMPGAILAFGGLVWLRRRR